MEQTFSKLERFGNAWVPNARERYRLTYMGDEINRKPRGRKVTLIIKAVQAQNLELIKILLGLDELDLLLVDESNQTVFYHAMENVQILVLLMEEVVRRGLVDSLEDFCLLDIAMLMKRKKNPLETVSILLDYVPNSGTKDFTLLSQLIYRLSRHKKKYKSLFEFTLDEPVQQKISHCIDNMLRNNYVIDGVCLYVGGWRGRREANFLHFLCKFSFFRLVEGLFVSMKALGLDIERCLDVHLGYKPALFLAAKFCFRKLKKEEIEEQVLPTVRLLLENGAEVNDLCLGEHVLEYILSSSRNRGCEDLLLFFLDNGAKLENFTGEPSLQQMCVISGFSRLLERLYNDFDLVNCEGISNNTFDQALQSVLNTGNRKCGDKCLEILLLNGCQYQFAMMKALFFPQENSLRVIKKLLKMKLDLNTRFHVSMPFPFVPILRGDHWLTKMFLLNGADLWIEFEPRLCGLSSNRHRIVSYEKLRDHLLDRYGCSDYDVVCDICLKPINPLTMGTMACKVSTDSCEAMFCRRCDKFNLDKKKSLTVLQASKRLSHPFICNLVSLWSNKKLREPLLEAIPTAPYLDEFLMNAKLTTPMMIKLAHPRSMHTAGFDLSSLCKDTR